MGAAAIAHKLTSGKTTTKKAAKKTIKAAAKKSNGKQERKSTRIQIRDAKGNIVTGRDNTFTCPECKGEITGPWSYKKHLMNQHKYRAKQAGLNEQK